MLAFGIGTTSLCQRITYKLWDGLSGILAAMSVLSMVDGTPKLSVRMLHNRYECDTLQPCIKIEHSRWAVYPKRTFHQHLESPNTPLRGLQTQTPHQLQQHASGPWRIT